MRKLRIAPRGKSIPAEVIKSEPDRAWLGGLIQGEGAITAHYMSRDDTTRVTIDIDMAAESTIKRASEIVGVKATGPYHRRSWKPIWELRIDGRRAIKVLQEVLPYLEDEKIFRAKKAIEFFGPYGRKRGHYTALQIFGPGTSKRSEAGPVV